MFGSNSSKTEQKQNTSQADNASSAVSDIVLDDGAKLEVDIKDSSVSASGKGALAIGSGAKVTFSDQGAIKSSMSLAKEANKQAAKLAAQVITSNSKTAAQNLEFVSENQARTMEFVESTRQGNQALAADLASRALDLAEKRTGSESDQAMTLGTKLLYAAAILTGLFLLRKSSAK